MKEPGEKRLEPSRYYEVVRELEDLGISILRACRLAGYNRSNLYCCPKGSDVPAL